MNRRAVFCRFGFLVLQQITASKAAHKRDGQNRQSFSHAEILVRDRRSSSSFCSSMQRETSESSHLFRPQTRIEPSVSVHQATVRLSVHSLPSERLPVDYAPIPADAHVQFLGAG